jgi:hypothetical protein
MKKFTFLFLSVVILVVSAMAQAYEGNIQFDKKKQQAIAIDYMYPPEAVENAIIQRLEKLGYKAKEEKGLFNRDKGFLVYKKINIADISSARMDYMIKVERKSRKASDESVLYMVMMKDDQNAMPTMEAFDIGNAKTFLNTMLPDIEAANLELQIKAQEEVVAKAEKRLRDLKDDQASLEKKLEQNKSDQEKTQKDIENQAQSLEALKGKRKKS